jgi:hypothetical protein
MRNLTTLALVVMLVSINHTRGGYSVVAQGMSWIQCRAQLVNAGSGAWVDYRGDMRMLECRREAGDPDS